jgi:hypothetical protein
MGLRAQDNDDESRLRLVRTQRHLDIQGGRGQFNRQAGPILQHPGDTELLR